MTWKEILKEVREEAKREADAQEPVIPDPMEASRKREAPAPNPEKPLRWINVDEKPIERPGPPAPAPTKRYRIGGKDQADEEEESK
jgi:hypothetical protein